MATSRWHQDSAVAELIAHFNQPEKYDNWDAITASEYATILKETERCRKDFVYAARNYFWITNKKLGDQLFSLWPSQELILQKILEMKAKGLPQKIICIKARQLGCCLDPETQILTSDLRWIRIDDAAPGQPLVGVDEAIPPGKLRSQRKTRQSTVLARRDVYQPAFRLVMDNGQTLIATGDHRFLCKRRGGTEAIWRSVKKIGTKKTSAPIRVGDEIRYITKPWAESTYEDGWFGGMIDGEGSLRHRADCGGFEGTVAQVFNAAYDRALKYLEAREYSFRSDVDKRKGPDTSKFGDKPVARLVVNSMSQLLRLIGQTRPARFINKLWWEGCYLPKTKDRTSWSKVLLIEPLGIRRMVDLQTTTKTFIANGFVSHNSTLIEGLVAWRTMFFSNVNALVVSYDRSHASDVLFPIMCFIYDRMPWWLKPECASRKAEEGMFFENKDPFLRSTAPGLNSRIFVKGANSTTGVGQGIRLSAVHCSEFCDWEDSVAKDIIDEDMTNALVEDEGTFAILESTAKGANRWAHKLWKKCMELEDEAEWYPLFLPFFFEKTHVRQLAVDFRLEREDLYMRERIEKEWVKCDNLECEQYHYRFIRGEDRAETECATCHVGTVHIFVIGDEQLAWMQHRRRNAARDDESLKRLLQEQTSSGESAFQVTGYQIFGQKNQDFANSQVQPPIAFGDFDNAGNFHGCNPTLRQRKLLLGYFPCYQEDCSMDHTYDEAPLQIWEWPSPGAEYAVGADVSEGLGGRTAYSVGGVIRYSSSGGGDYQVATWRANTVDPIAFGYKLNHLGVYYNLALMAIECNRYDTCMTTVRMNLSYPNLYRWKHMDSLNVMSNKLGWWTNLSSRPRLWQTYKRWLQQELFHPRSRNLVEEMKNFVKEEEDDTSASGDRDETDDELFAIMIALYTAHEGDWNDALGMVMPKAELTKDNARFVLACRNCKHEWPENTIEDTMVNPAEFVPQLDPQGRVKQSGGMRCPACNAINIQISRNQERDPGTSAEDALWKEATGLWTPDRAFADAPLPDYDLL